MFDRYLKILHLKAQPPSLEYLQKLVEAQLCYVPYENISKILRLKNKGPSIPSLEEFIEGNENFGFGGTCFVQNGYFVQLLQHLGFQAELIGVGFSAEGSTHPCCRVHLKDESYLIDLGNFSSFAGPFPLAPGTEMEAQLGDWLYKYQACENLTHKMESFRNGKPGRTWRSHSPVRELSFFESAIGESFSKDSIFMTTLAAHRVIDQNPVFQWGATAGSLKGQHQEKIKVANLEELQKVFAEILKLPRYPMREAAEFLAAYNGTDLFSKASP